METCYVYVLSSNHSSFGIVYGVYVQILYIKSCEIVDNG